MAVKNRPIGVWGRLPFVFDVLVAQNRDGSFDFLAPLSSWAKSRTSSDLVNGAFEVLVNSSGQLSALGRRIFVSVQTYERVEPGKEQKVRLLHHFITQDEKYIFQVVTMGYDTLIVVQKCMFAGWMEIDRSHYAVIQWQPDQKVWTVLFLGTAEHEPLSLASIKEAIEGSINVLDKIFPARSVANIDRSGAKKLSSLIPTEEELISLFLNIKEANCAARVVIEFLNITNLERYLMAAMLLQEAGGKNFLYVGGKGEYHSAMIVTVVGSENTHKTSVFALLPLSRGVYGEDHSKRFVPENGELYRPADVPDIFFLADWIKEHIDAAAKID